MREKLPSGTEPMILAPESVATPGGETVIAPAGAQPTEPDPLIGEVLADRYHVERRLGAGGMGTVYAGIHVALQRRVAVKVIQARYGADPGVALRFSQEARAASAIGHEHIVQIIDFGESRSGSPYLVMEYLDGEDLEATVTREGPLPWRRVVHIAEQIARALAAAHAQGIIHRDIKPANCMRVPRDGDEDFIKVLDFGLAKVLTGDNRSGPAVTRTGALLGTPGYMAPELFRGWNADLRADIYSLGALMHKLLTDELPPIVHGGNVAALRAVAAPGNVIAILGRALSDELDSRYPTAHELMKALQAVKNGMLSPSDPPPRQVRPAAPPLKMAYGRCRSYMVLIHGVQSPSDEEWGRYIAQIEAHANEIRGFLIITKGGGPSSGQRRALKQMLDRVGLKFERSAVVAADRLTRGIVIAVNLFAPNIQAFRPDDLEQALTHIQAVGPDRVALHAEIEWLTEQVGP